jgi:hypothetical protein
MAQIAAECVRPEVPEIATKHHMEKLELANKSTNDTDKRSILSKAVTQAMVDELTNTPLRNKRKGIYLTYLSDSKHKYKLSSAMSELIGAHLGKGNDCDERREKQNHKDVGQQSGSTITIPDKLPEAFLSSDIFPDKAMEGLELYLTLAVGGPNCCMKGQGMYGSPFSADVVSGAAAASAKNLSDACTRIQEQYKLFAVTTTKDRRGVVHEEFYNILDGIHDLYNRGDKKFHVLTKRLEQLEDFQNGKNGGLATIQVGD